MEYPARQGERNPSNDGHKRQKYQFEKIEKNYFRYSCRILLLTFVFVCQFADKYCGSTIIKNLIML